VGLSDDVVLLDGNASCPEGHVIGRVQTKDLDRSMSTYVLAGGVLRQAIQDTEDEGERWRVEDDVAIREERFRTEVVPGPRTLRGYASCERCAPILVRTDGRGVFDLVDERRPFVDFEIVLGSGAPTRIVRTSGTREEQVKDMLARGLHVLRDDEPLAVAHREAKDARARLDALEGRHRGRGWP
jgi:hypothetical protein